MCTVEPKQIGIGVFQTSDGQVVVKKKTGGLPEGPAGSDRLESISLLRINEETRVLSDGRLIDTIKPKDGKPLRSLAEVAREIEQRFTRRGKA